MPREAVDGTTPGASTLKGGFLTPFAAVSPRPRRGYRDSRCAHRTSLHPPTCPYRKGAVGELSGNSVIGIRWRCAGIGSLSRLSALALGLGSSAAAVRTRLPVSATIMRLDTRPGAGRASTRSLSPRPGPIETEGRFPTPSAGPSARSRDRRTETRSGTGNRDQDPTPADRRRFPETETERTAPDGRSPRRRWPAAPENPGNDRPSNLRPGITR